MKTPSDNDDIQSLSSYECDKSQKWQYIYIYITACTVVQAVIMLFRMTYMLM